MTSSAPATFHLAGKRRIIGGSSWEVIFTLGRTAGDGITTAASATLESATAGFDALDIGAEVVAIDPRRPEGKNARFDVIAEGTVIDAVTDATHATLSAPAGATTERLVVRIYARDIATSTFAANIKEYATDPEPPIEDIEAVGLPGAPRGRVRMRLTAGQTANLASRIGSPRPAQARGVFDLFELVGTERYPRLAGAVEVELAVTQPAAP